MRKFRIQNESGVGWDLNYPPVLFHQPSGLGIQWAVNTADLGYGFYRKLETPEMPADPITGDLLFTPPSAYETYRQFINFLMSSKVLILAYTPYGNQDFFVQGTFQTISKSELGQDRVLTVPMTFVPFTPWYRPTQLDLVLEPAETDILEFPFTFSQDLHFPSATGRPWTGVLTPSGHLPAALKFDYSGAADNPVLQIEGINTGTIYGTCAVSGSIPGFSFSSMPQDSYVRDGAGNDLNDLLDPAVDPYVRMPNTEPCYLTLTASNTLTGSASASIVYYYRGV